MIKELERWLYLFNRGEDFESYHRFGAHQVAPGRWQFLVWAPHAKQVGIEGDFNQWQATPLMALGDTGSWIGELAAEAGQLYKVLITTASGQQVEKVDPFAFAFEKKPGTAARLTNNRYEFHDEIWMRRRKQELPYSAPVNIYELHLGSFKRGEQDQYLTYREAIDTVLPYVKQMGYTHIELMPLTEHLLDASWGYQAFGYFAPTSRFGSPDDFFAFVDAAHRMNLGVIMDWVPGHFIRNTDVLATFDGTATFEYSDPHRANNAGWGTWNFDLGKAQVQSYLISSAMFWLKEAHLDGLRVDAVSNMLYMDYDVDKQGDRNRDGGRENLEGLAFIKKLTKSVFAALPDVLLVAEESTAYPKVSAPIDAGGLGFNYKWNMGWMNDTLKYFELPPHARHGNMNLLTFSFMYQFDEQFVLPFSHDEVVHGKKSLMHKMPGDRYNQFANLRVMYVWLMTHPGKKLLFMGSEWGQFLEWREYSALEWRDLADPLNHAMQAFTRELNKFYLKHPALWVNDHKPEGIEITMGDRQDVLSYVRFGETKADFVVVTLNLQPQEQQHFKLPVPQAGTYRIELNTESHHYGGTWVRLQRTVRTGDDGMLEVVLPASGALLIVPQDVQTKGVK